MGFGTRKPTSNDPEDLGEGPVEFSRRVQKEEKEKRKSEFDKLWDEYADGHRGDVQVGWVAAMIKEAARWFYRAGRKAENALWEESDPGFAEEDFH